LSVEDIDAFVDIAVNAYPGWRVATEEERDRVRERLIERHESPATTFYGLFRDGRLLGGMCLHTFTMNFLGTWVEAGGVGNVAVDLVHKKEHVAKEMLLYFLRHWRERGVPVTMLYPFRPDFYRNMGFGYGTKLSQYRVRPAGLPRGPSKAHVRHLNEGDERAVLDCYNRFADRVHGMIRRSEREVAHLMRNPQMSLVGHEAEGRILGYLAFSFELSDAFLVNDLHVRELVYESREALSELLTFLHAQADQVRRVIFDTQDEAFHHLLEDPRNGAGWVRPHVCHTSNVQGVGIMYRVSDVARAFTLLEGRDFGGQTCALELTVEDSFLPENAGTTHLRFEDGCARLADGGACDVAVRLDVADFSSLLVGAVDFRSLYRYGLADVSDPEYVDVVDRLFAVRDRPVCMTSF